MILYLLIITLFGISAFASVTSLLLIRSQQQSPILTPARKKTETVILPPRVVNSVTPFLRPITNLTYFKQLKLQAETLNINWKIEILILLKIFTAILLGILSLVLFSARPQYVLAVVAMGFFVPDFIWRSKIKAKKAAIVKVFPETVDLLDMCIGAGLDFRTSLRWIIDKSESNAFVEQLEVVLNEIRVGKSTFQALKDMAKRLNIPDVNSFARSLIQAERMGTSLEETFRNLSEDTRMMRFQAGERYAIKASVKILFPLLFCILPVIFIVVAGPIIVQFTQGGLFPSGGGF
jgi:pilus assembly protein TadC